jgi:hypothetical protein
MLLKPVVYWYTNKCHLLPNRTRRNYLYVQHKLNDKIRRVRWQSNVLVRNQVNTNVFKMIRLYNTVIVLNIVIATE